MKNYIYKFNIFNPKEVVHGVSQKHFGSIMTKRIINKKNLENFLKALGISKNKVIFPNQIHSSKVLIVDDIDRNKDRNDGDGLITKTKNLFLAIVTADCLPIVFYEKKKKIIAVAHAGYKGIYKGVIKDAIDKFIKIGGDIKEIQIAVGPSIGECCYDVSIERKEMFEEKFGNGFIESKGDKYYLNLKKIALSLFIFEGIKKDNIEISKICTKCSNDRFFSYRGDKKNNHGEFITLAGLI